MSVTYEATVICDRCANEHTVHEDGKPVSGVNARLSAFAAGWATRRNHAGSDICPACRAAP